MDLVEVADVEEVLVVFGNFEESVSEEFYL